MSLIAIVLMPYIFAVAAFRIMKDGRLIAATWLVCMVALGMYRGIPLTALGPLVLVATAATILHAALVRKKVLEGSEYAYPELVAGVPFWAPFAWMWVALTAYLITG